MKKAEISNLYSSAKQQAEQFHPIFRAYQKLAGNVVDVREGCNAFPHGEGTYASIVRKTPPRVLKDMPIGQIRNISDPFQAIVNEALITDTFQRFAQRENGLIQAFRHTIEEGLSFGFDTATLFFTQVEGAYTVDFRRHYWADVFPVPGVTNMNDGDVFIRDWWSKTEIENLIEASKDDDTLNTQALKSLIECEQTSRDSSNQSEMNRRASVSNLGYEVIRYYVLEDGKYMLYIFAPNGKTFDDTEFIQEKELPCRGHVHYYNDPDFQTPFGRPLASLVGGMQIDLDQAQRNRRKAREIEIDPMVILNGYTMSKVNIAPGTMINLPPQSQLSTFEMRTKSLDSYNEDKSADQAAIYQITGQPEGNSAGNLSGDAAVGKTPTAIKAAQSNIDNDDNRIADNLKLYLELFFTQALKIYYYNLPDEFLIEVSSEYEQKILQVAPERIIAPGVVLVTNDLDLFDYVIDIESATDDINAMKLDSIYKVLGLFEQSPMMAQRVAELGILDDLIQETLYATGLKNDNIAKKLSFLDSPQGVGSPEGVPFPGEPIPGDIAQQMAGTAPDVPDNPVVQTQPPNPVRQEGMM